MKIRNITKRLLEFTKEENDAFNKTYDVLFDLRNSLTEEDQIITNDGRRYDVSQVQHVTDMILDLCYANTCELAIVKKEEN